MATYNNTTFIGNLVRDPETRFLTSGASVTNFTVAVNRKYKKQDGEDTEETAFIDCETFGRLSEIIGQYTCKGSSVHVSGRLKTDSWTTQDGQKRSKLKVVAENVQFLDNRNGSEPTHSRQQQQASAPAPAVPPPADLGDDSPPF